MPQVNRRRLPNSHPPCRRYRPLIDSPRSPTVIRSAIMYRAFPDSDLFFDADKFSATPLSRPLDTLFSLNDDRVRTELGRHYGHRGLAAEPWPRTVRRH